MGPLNLGAIQRAHQTFLADLNRVLDQEAQEAGEFGKGYVRQNTPGFTSRTGELVRSTEYRIVRTKGGRVVKLRNTAKHARPVDRGSRAHIIRAKSGGMLRFVSGGSVIFRRQVRHPGTRPTWFLRTANQKAFEHFSRNADQSLNRLAARFRRARA